MPYDPGVPAGLVMAAADVDRPAIIGPAHSISYGELAETVREVAAGLRDRGVQRFACLSSDPTTTAVLFIAASAVGAEACAYPASADARELDALRSNFEHDVLISDGTVGIDGAWLSMDDLTAGASQHGTAAPIGQTDDTPVLVLTTGTTGTPKGARHDWRRLVQAASRWKSPAGSRWLLAYNLNQFAGVQVLLHVLVSSATLIIPERLQPRVALAAMVEHEVTRASATPTFWRHLLTQITDATPLPDLAQITLGGERVPGTLPPDLQARFPTARISQVYASTEFGSGAAVGDTEEGLPRSVLDRGLDDDVRLRIVDGELQVWSRVGMLGYHGQDDNDDGWRPTGDLVEIHGDRIHFVGRTAEVINVGGVKVHPSSVEDRVLGVEGVVNAHARGRANPVAGQIVMLDVVSDDGVDADELEDAIRAACSGLPAAAQPRRIRFVDELEEREGKLRRGGGQA